jgi:hypothetical protein
MIDEVSLRNFVALPPGAYRFVGIFIFHVLKCRGGCLFLRQLASVSIQASVALG